MNVAKVITLNYVNREELFYRVEIYVIEAERNGLSVDVSILPTTVRRHQNRGWVAIGTPGKPWFDIFVGTKLERLSLLLDLLNEVKTAAGLIEG